MANRRFRWCTGLLALVVLLCLTALGLMLKHEPTFFDNARPPSEIRHDEALRFSTRFWQMSKDIQTSPTWGFDATETRINSFLEEGFPYLEQAERMRKLGITDPVIKLDDDCIRLAFRYGSGWFSTVISYDLQVWLVPKDDNAVAIKVLRARAGAVPISSQTILHRLAELAREQNIDMNLYRHEGKSVAILKLGGGGDPLNPTWKLTALKVGNTEQGPIMLAIRGRTPDHFLPLPPIALPKADVAQ